MVLWIIITVLKARYELGKYFLEFLGSETVDYFI